MSQSNALIAQFLKEIQASCNLPGCNWSFRDDYNHAGLRMRRARREVYQHLFLRHNIGAMDATVETIDNVPKRERKTGSKRKAGTGKQTARGDSPF